MDPKAFVENNRLPLSLVLVGLILVSGGFLLPKLNLAIQEPAVVETKAGLVIDVGGAVQKPGVYEIQDGGSSRVEDAITLAGGFDDDADLDWVSKNINLASVLKDEMKVYIPKKGELAGTDSTHENSSTNVLGVTNGVNINLANEAELDKLPGVGEVTARKIIENRPYVSIDDLLTRKIVPTSTFEKIKRLVKI